MNQGRSHRDRSRARAWALQVLYRWETEGRETPGVALRHTLTTRRVAPARRDHLVRIVEGVDGHLTEIDDEVRAVLENWRLDRLSVIDRSILRIGALELLFFDDVPSRVAIQESVRLAERYGGQESSAFVNGVLDALLHRRASRTP